MTLLLGPPGFGKTTLLLALCGKLDPSLRLNEKEKKKIHSLCSLAIIQFLDL